ncbi:MAG: recombinase RecT [Clostridia bacterium]|nr:recombinase RecT [Clostridia bacterium]
MGNMSVYRQMVSSEESLFAVLKNEIGMKTSCVPFGVKAIDALSSLGTLGETEALKAANTFLDNLQTLQQGGITAEDYDKIDFVKRGKVITITARVEAFLRAAARKGYRIIDTITAVPKEDADTTYYKENFYNGDIIYTLEDRRFQADRDIKAERVIGNYFKKYLCRLDVTEISSGKRLLMTVCEMSNDELLEISKTSEQGFYKVRWEKYTDNYGKERKKKVVTDELNPDSFWCKWTGEMVKKTIIRRALKRVKEVLPELKDTIYAFEREPEEEISPTPKEIDIPPISEPEIEIKVNLNKLTAEQKADVKETLELFKANPKLAKDKTTEMKIALQNGKPVEEVINEEYPAIMNIKRSKTLWPEISGYFKENANEESKP